MLYYDTLNSEQQISYLIKPIIEVLQEAGGQLDRSEIRDRISEKDEHIAEFEQKIYTSSKTGNQYKKFDFKFKVKLQSAIAKMSPAKFEQFSRALLTKMGVQFTSKSVQISNDGGIDGYGYHIDEDDFRTTRVVIQCKRFNR